MQQFNQQHHLYLILESNVILLEDVLSGDSISIISSHVCQMMQKNLRIFKEKQQDEKKEKKNKIRNS